MTRLIALLFLCAALTCFGQTTDELLKRVNFAQAVPADLLATRSVVFYGPEFSNQNLLEVQKAFQQTGIDAVAYYQKDIVLSGNDVSSAFARYFVSRDIRYLLFLSKTKDACVFSVTTFNSKQDFVEQNQGGWQLKNPSLKELLLDIYRAAINSQKKQNFLINDFPEPGAFPSIIDGRRSEYYAFDLKLDKLAVPKFGNESMDRELETFFKENYPFEYALTEPGIKNEDLRKQGFIYILCYVHTRLAPARDILDYSSSQSESAIASVTYPNGQMQMKAIPAETTVYKFYFRHLDTGNVFLGPKWDADVTWQEALRNQVLGFKTELK